MYQTASGLLVANTADGAALADSTLTETIISPTPDLILPPNSLNVGTTISWVAMGRITWSTTSTLTLRVRYGGVGGVILVSTGALTPAVLTNGTWSIEGQLTCRSIGATGTLMAGMQVSGITSATGTNQAPATAPATATIDTTTQNTLVLTAIWSSTHSSSIQLHQWIVTGSN